jgi:hypothetical protein
MAGNEETTHASFAILNQLLRTLTTKGVLSNAEVIALVNRAAINLEAQTTGSGKNAAIHIRNHVLPDLKK